MKQNHSNSGGGTLAVYNGLLGSGLLGMGTEEDEETKEEGGGEGRMVTKEGNRAKMEEEEEKR